MTLPTGQIGFNQVNSEILRPTTNTLALQDSVVRNLAGRPTASTVIGMNDLQGKSYTIGISVTINSNASNFNVFNSRGSQYVAGATNNITVTVSPGVVVGSTSTGSYAMSVPNQFGPLDTIRIVNQGLILGAGGPAGVGGAFNNSPAAGSGSGGGSALLVQRPTTIQNAGTISSGGGGGGGGGGRNDSTFTPRPTKQGGPFTTTTVGGGGGAGGGAGSAGGIGGGGGACPPAPAQAGGSGQNAGATTPGQGGTGGNTAGSGGAGGGLGSAGAGGGQATSQGAGGGATGSYLVGSPFVTWQQTGTRQGNVS